MPKKENSERFCSCRSRDSSGFMIQCEKCDIWFHGRCVNIKKKKANSIQSYYCDSCISADSKLKIVYKSLPTEQLEEISTKQEPLEERKQEKKELEKNVRAPAKASAKPQARVSQTTKRKGNPKAKSKRHEPKQCANPECIYEAKATSKYCSPECGYETNEKRYERHFVDKWKRLSKHHSQARLNKMKELEQLEKDKADVELLIKNLKTEKEETEQAIAAIKDHAKKLYQENEKLGKQNDDDDDVEMENEDVDVLSGDNAKTYCVTCGTSILGDNPFLHWTKCHKKHDYDFTANALFKHSVCKEDENPKLYCHQEGIYLTQNGPEEGKKHKEKRYCMNYSVACPQHTKWEGKKDEVCGCPLTIMQKLVPDGNYCLELKKDCNQHYHWDRFRLTLVDMDRVKAFSHLDKLVEQIINVSKSLEDTYGGVVGVMLHNTLNHTSELTN